MREPSSAKSFLVRARPSGRASRLHTDRLWRNLAHLHTSAYALSSALIINQSRQHRKGHAQNGRLPNGNCDTCRGQAGKIGNRHRRRKTKPAHGRESEEGGALGAQNNQQTCIPPDTRRDGVQTSAGVGPQIRTQRDTRRLGAGLRP